ncbi:MAG: hypothetical protein QOD66_2698 [Solirubrobacteraceae bacterium]|jgi:predicted secreted hydrolase|nr:hypothetical protein [Solirubrobacteraceae bacterium]
MSRSSALKSRRFRAAALAASALAVVIPQVSSAVVDHGGSPAAARSAAVPASGFPTFVHLPADQAAHPSATEEWWYTVGHVSARGHEYGYEVQLVSAGVAELAIDDVTAGKYYTQQVFYQPGQFSVSATKLDVRLPDATLSGPLHAMHLTATLPQARLDLRLNAKGPVLYDNGTGLFPFLKGSSYYYSLPDLQTSGTVTIGRKTSKVTGQSWLDRQWGTWDWTQLHRWTWMAIQLRNGESINLWDLFSTQGEQRWATVLHRDGSESLASISPVAKHATRFATSPTTHQRYAGKWIVEIPSLKTRLTVTATPTLQEIQARLPFTPGIDEAASTATGTYQGKRTTGQAFVEQFGIWK